MLLNYKLILLKPITKLMMFWMYSDISFKLIKTVCQENTKADLFCLKRLDVQVFYFTRPSNL